MAKIEKKGKYKHGNSVKTKKATFWVAFFVL